MKVREFLAIKFQLDVSDATDPMVHDLKNQFINSGLNYPQVFDKELSQLNDDEIYYLFKMWYIYPGGRPRTYSEIVELGKEKMQGY